MTDTALAATAIGLARQVVELMPTESEARGLLALLMLQHSRRDARTGPSGELLLDALGPQLPTYWLLPAAQADLFARAGRPADAARCYRASLALTDAPAERAEIERRLALTTLEPSAPR